MIEFQKFTLENGLKVLFHQDKNTPIAALNLLYDVGARDEDPERTGFAHLFEHLMFGGSVNIPSYDEMKDVLESRLSKQKVDAMYAQSTERLADITYSSPDLEEASEALGLSIESLVGVSVNTNHAIFSNRKIQKVLFSEDLISDKHNSELIEFSDGHAVVFRVENYQEESLQNLNTVKDSIRDKLKIEKSSDYAKNVGETFIERVNGG